MVTTPFAARHVLCDSWGFKMTQRLTSADMRTLLRKRYPKGEWALAFEVANATGGNSRRYADAVAMNLWPSRGLALHGFEVKVSKSDWKNELNQPAKAEAVAKYCDFWWVVAPEGIVSPVDLPAPWGLMVPRNDCLCVVKPASQKDHTPVTRDFMAALFRRISDADRDEIEAAARVMAKEIDASREQQFEYRVKSRLTEYDRLQKKVDEFEKASGMDLSHWSMVPRDFGRAVKFVMDNNVFGTYRSIEDLRESMKLVLETMDCILSEQPTVELVRTR